MEFYGEAVNDCEALNSVMKKAVILELITMALEKVYILQIVIAKPSTV